jgi:hypothetical protein
MEAVVQSSMLEESKARGRADQRLNAHAHEDAGDANNGSSIHKRQLQ